LGGGAEGGAEVAREGLEALGIGGFELEFGFKGSGTLGALVVAEHAEGSGEFMSGTLGFGALGIGEQPGVGGSCGGIKLGEALEDKRLAALPEIGEDL
jgi:hypothetical protein